MVRKLDEYQRRRDSSITPEPEALETRSGKQLRFVVQHHTATLDHYDFRLEWDGVLLSWAVPKGPSYNPKEKRLAVEVEDHPLEYRNFEGTIPQGEYGGGVVMLWDEGEWEPRVDVEKGLKEGALKLLLKGSRLKGKWALVRLKGENGEKKNWLLIKEKDKFALDNDGIAEYKTSVRSNRAMKEIEDDKQTAQCKDGSLPFQQTGVQLARLVDKVPEGEGWIFELKYDGYRIISYVENNQVRLLSRNGTDYTDKFISIADSLIEWSDGRTMVLDGEVVVLGSHGQTDFQALQRFLRSPRGQTLTYIVFDLLALSGRDLRGEPLKDRKEKLSSLMQKHSSGLHYSKHTASLGRDALASACQVKMEGIICKREKSLYSGKRNGDWLKVKCENRQEFVIGGYTLTDRKKSGVSALLLGVYEGQDLIYVGRAGTGFTQKTIKILESQFEQIKRKTAPFKEAPKQRSDEIIAWLSPKLVAEIRFLEWTDENQLRQASYKGLRTDKAPQEVKREDPTSEDVPQSSVENTATDKITGSTKSAMPTRKSTTVQGIRISSPDKEMFEGTGITKEGIAQYYNDVSKRMMLYTENRVLSLVRCPDGTSGECFYQKHLLREIKGMKVIAIEENNGDSEDYFYLDGAEGLIRSVQMGTVELHIWGSRVENIEAPDMMVFDLDPAEGMELERVREGVWDMKNILDELSLTSYLKTSGGKGYHVVVPLEPSADWTAVKTFAKMTASAMEERWPDKYTSNMRKENRQGKIFVDWLRNGRGATSVAPYSVRAREGAPVSMPITWGELNTVKPNEITLRTSIERLKKEDPWTDFFKVKQRVYDLNSAAK